MSIATEISRIQSAKTDIRTAIEAKGVTVPSSATIDTYDGYVSQISGGGGVQMPSKLSAIELTNYGLIQSATISSAVTAIESSAFQSCSSIKSIDIPNSVTTIGDYAFHRCGSIKSIDIPNSVTSIGDEAFGNCNSIKSIDIPNSVTTIGDYVFRDCTSLSSITIPDSVTSIGNNAFYFCRSLSSIDIPSGVTSIGNQAFYFCTGLTSVTVNATTPPTLGSNVFSNTSNDLVIYVPSESVSTYQSAWSDYSTRITAIPNS